MRKGTNNMKADKILKRPIITEKTIKMVEDFNKYVFEVSKSASAGNVKDSVEAVFGVKVLGVSMLKTRGKLRRSMVGKRIEFKSKDVKKAIVKLAEKDSIKLFEKN